MASVAFQKVSKSYGKVEVINDFDLEIADEEFMVLVGPSGCGKSTLLRMIAGLEEITAGTIAIGERVVNELPPKDRDIAMVFQNYALYPHMSVRENLEFGLKMRKTPKSERAHLVKETAEILGITDFLERKPRQLSGGQRQRVAVGRAIVRKPSVFLFDEPLSNLDAKLRVQMRAEITKLQQRLKTTTVYVTHDQVEAMTMGDRIAVLNDGVLQQVGTPLDLYENPGNVFVANFIGTPPMNFFPATVESGQLVGASFRLPVPDHLRAITDRRAGGKVIVGIRPERIEGAGGGATGSARETTPGSAVPGSAGAVSARVEIVELLGHEVVVHGRVGDEPIVAKLEPHHIPEMGSVIDLRLDLAALQLFDAGTEVRLRD